MKAVDLMRDLKPLILVPQHFLPAYGEECIMDILTCYRDAIQYTHDQTVRFMNKGDYSSNDIIFSKYFNKLLWILFFIKIRKGILEVSQFPNYSEVADVKGDSPRISKSCRVKVWTTSTIWRNILCKETSALKANMMGHLSCDPGIRQLGTFMEYFDKN